MSAGNGSHARLVYPAAGTAHALDTSSSPTWVGSYTIAFQARVGSLDKIFEIGSDARPGTEPRQVTSGATGKDAHPEWSPQGGLLYLHTATVDGLVTPEILVQPPGASTPSRVPAPGTPGDPSWAPDGHQVLYLEGSANGPSRPVIIDLDGTPTSAGTLTATPVPLAGKGVVVAAAWGTR